MNKILFTVLLWALLVGGAQAQAQALSEAEWRSALAALPAGDAARGHDVYNARGCAGCHGAAGVPDNRDWPVLAGQRPVYVYKMLLDYRAKRLGGNDAATMSGVVAELGEQEMADVAAWIGGLRRPPAPAAAPPSIVKGDRSRLIPPCEACHGANGQGWDLQPAIAGQHRAYLSAALRRFQSGERANDINSGMGQLARKLTEDEIRSLAHYYGR